MKLTNELFRRLQRCDDCTILLRNSRWRNEIVFLKNKKKYFCIRCLNGKISPRELDNFVKNENNGIIPEILKPPVFLPKKKIIKIKIMKNRPTRLTIRCTRHQHKQCKSVSVHCTCSCHRKKNIKITNNLFNILF